MLDQDVVRKSVSKLAIHFYRLRGGEQDKNGKIMFLLHFISLKVMHIKNIEYLEESGRENKL